MKELVRHIESLLLEYNCVIVPEIGGFVTQDLPARYVEEEHLFLPPIRTVGFNRNLTNDDGLLSASYARTYNNVDKGNQMMRKHIDDLKCEMLESGIYDMGSIGMLTMKENNEFYFSPCQAGTISPSFYGLDAVICSPIERNIEKTNVKPKLIRKTETSDITITLKRSWLNNIAAVAAAVILFFLFSPDAQNTEMQTVEKAEFAQLLPFVPKSVYMTPVPSVTVAEKSEMLSENMEQSAEKLNVTPDEVPNGYCIVVASAIPMQNALKYADKLRAEGYNNVQVYKNNEMIRVIFTGYISESDAYNHLRKLSSNEEFSSAWVYQIK